jgi:branched-chain amino acid transport system permease protein
MTWFAVNIIRSKYGRAIIAIRDNDRAAEGMGIPIFKYKLCRSHQFFLCRVCGRTLGILHGQHYDGTFNLGLSLNISPWLSSAAWAIFPSDILALPLLHYSMSLLRFVTGVLMNVPAMPVCG